MAELITMRARVATNHPLPAYGGVTLSVKVLHQLADALAAGTIPMQVNHDPARPLGGRCLSAEVVDLPDGHKAVEALFEVDREGWEQYQRDLSEAGAPGGMSFTASEPIATVSPTSETARVELGLHGDAAHFTDEDLLEAAEELAAVGSVNVGRLLQFSYAPACRIIIDYVHESGGLSATGAEIAIGLNLISSAIFAALSKLLPRRSPREGAQEPAQIELHRTSSPGGVTVQTLKISTDSEEVLKHALDRLIEPAENSDWGVALWDEDAGQWRPPST